MLSRIKLNKNFETYTKPLKLASRKCLPSKCKVQWQ